MFSGVSSILSWPTEFHPVSSFYICVFSLVYLPGFNCLSPRLPMGLLNSVSQRLLIIIQPFKNSLNWSFTRKNHLYIQNAKTECLWGITMEDLLFWLLDPLSKSLYLFYHYRHYNQHNLLQCLPRVCSLFGQRKNVPDIFYMYSLSFLNIFLFAILLILSLFEIYITHIV